MLKIFFRTLLCLVGQYEVTKKKSPETANNIPARGSSGGSTRLPVQGSSGGVACHRGSGSHLPAQGSFEAAQGNSGGAACHRSSCFHLPAPRSRRAAPGAPRVTAALVPTSRLRAAPGPRRAAPEVLRVIVAPVPTSRLRAAPGLVRVLWAPAPASRHRTAPRVPHVPAALDQMKTFESSSSENIAPYDYFFSTHRPAQGSSRGSACPRGSRPNETVEPMQKT
jgi:hypothetical protein